MINQLIIVMLHAQIQIFFRTGWGGGGVRGIFMFAGFWVGWGLVLMPIFWLFYNAMLRNVYIYVSLVWIPPPHGFPLDKIMKLDIYIITVIPSSPKPMKNLNEIINCYPFLIKLPNFHPP